MHADSKDLARTWAVANCSIRHAAIMMEVRGNPHRSGIGNPPLPWGEVGPQRRVSDYGLSGAVPVPRAQSLGTCSHDGRSSWTAVGQLIGF
jgi:hypothetical protein